MGSASNEVAQTPPHFLPPLATLHSAIIDGIQAAITILDSEYRILLSNKFL